MCKKRFFLKLKYNFYIFFIFNDDRDTPQYIHRFMRFFINIYSKFC